MPNGTKDSLLFRIAFLELFVPALLHELSQNKKDI